MSALARSRSVRWRKVRGVTDLRVESCHRHIERVANSLAFQTAAISIVYQRRSPETPKLHDHTSASTRVRFVERRPARDMVAPMNPDWWRACAVDVTALQRAAKSSCFWFLSSQ